MRSPYTYQLKAHTERGQVLDTSAPLDTTLAQAERAGHMQAWEWLNTGLVDVVHMGITDGKGTEVRRYYVYDCAGNGLGNSIVRERVG